MSKGIVCKCPGPIADRLKNFEILTYKGNYSAFNGYKFEPSIYSSLRCKVCQSVWRSKATYVNKLKFSL